jgi:hypothetical protein
MLNEIPEKKIHIENSNNNNNCHFLKKKLEEKILNVLTIKK